MNTEDWIEASISQGIPMFQAIPESEGKGRASLQASEATWSYCHLDFRPLASRIARQHISVILSYFVTTVLGNIILYCIVLYYIILYYCITLPTLASFPSRSCHRAHDEQKVSSGFLCFATSPLVLWKDHSPKS